MTPKFDPTDPANEQLNEAFLAAHPEVDRAIDTLDALEHQVMNLDYQRTMIRRENDEMLKLASNKTLTVAQKEEKLRTYLAETGKDMGEMARVAIGGIVLDMQFNAARERYMNLRAATEKLIDAEMEAWNPEPSNVTRIYPEAFAEATADLPETQPMDTVPDGVDPS